MSPKKWGKCKHLGTGEICDLSKVRCIDTQREECGYEA